VRCFDASVTTSLLRGIRIWSTLGPNLGFRACGLPSFLGADTAKTEGLTRVSTKPESAVYANRCIRQCHGDSQLVPTHGTKVQFTGFIQGSILKVSRLGGGLFKRPVIRKDLGRFLIFGTNFPLRPAFRTLQARD